MPEKNAALSKRKKRLLKIILPLLLFLILCTFLSRTISGMFLPAVEVATIEPGTISSTADFSGVVEYEGVQQLTAASDWTIINIYVKENQGVKKGDVLFEIDMGQANVLLLQQQATVMQMEAAVQDATTEEAGVLQLQLEAERQQLSFLEQQYPAQGKIVAEENGTITGIQIEENGFVSQGDLVMRLIPENAQPIVSWEMDLDAGEIFNENDRAVIRSVFYDSIENQAQSQELDSVISEKTFQPSTNRYVCKASFPYSGAVAEGKPVEIQLMKESGQYDLVLPTSCLLPHESNSQNMGNVYVLETREGLFGTEYVAKRVEVNVLDQNNLRAAVSGDLLMPGTKVITDVGSLPIQDGSVVKVEAI